MSWPKRFVRPTRGKRGGKISEGTRVTSQATRVKDRARARDYAIRKRMTDPALAARKAQHDEMVAELGVAVCAICGRPPEQRRRLSIDHDHVTGLVRGLLCRKCNAGIGLLGDSVEGLEAALEYLRRHKANPGIRRFAGETAA